MLYTHRWLIAISGLILFLLVDIGAYLYPLYLMVIDKQHVARELTTKYQITNKRSLTRKTTALSPEKEPLIPYHPTVWLSELTRKISELSVSINKIEKITTNDLSNTTHWHVSLSGNAYTLFRSFSLLYHDFPWLAIAEPHFTLNNHDVSVSFQLIALLQKPANRRPLIPAIQTKRMLFPFCQSPQQYTMQNITFKLNRIAGVIQYGQTKTTLTRIDNEHVALTMQALKT